MLDTLQDVLKHFENKRFICGITIVQGDVEAEYSYNEIHDEHPSLLDRDVDDWKYDCENDTLRIDLWK